MNRTENYQLTQWEKSDRIMMDDFNDNNSKIDAALARLDHMALDAAYYAAQLALRDMAAGAEAMFSQQAILYHTFQKQSSLFSLSGGAVIQDGALRLKSGQTKGAAVYSSAAVFTPHWSRARMWIHGSGSGFTPKINGTEMTYADLFTARSATGILCEETVFDWTGPHTNNVVVSFDMEKKYSADVIAYDFAVFFY